MLSIAETDNIKSYKYMSDIEGFDFNNRIIDILKNTKYMEIQIYEEKGFTNSIGDGEKVYIVEVYEKNMPGFDELEFPNAMAVMGHEEVKIFEKSVSVDNKVEIFWIYDSK